ncbi:MAG: hypothetical protein KBF43_16335 [Dermatophilaceae bacterium]|nr:hypothetical protein [Dermatophilaceae bacterium]
MTPDDRAQLRALLAAATPGEWAPGTPDDDVAETRAEWVRTCLVAPAEPAAGALWSVWVPDDEEVSGSRIVAITGDGAHGMADAELIATAANSLSALLDALDAAEAGIEQVRALHRPDPTPDDAIAAWLTTPEQAARISPTPDLAELRRRHAALTPFALRFRSGGPGGDPYIALAGEDGSPLSESGFDAVLMFAEIAAADLPSLLNAADERDALAAKVERVRALHFGEYVEDEDRNRCFECGDDWPCPTVRALEEEPQP